MVMEFRFNLNKHCVETESKKIYERLIKRYLDKNCSGKEKGDIEERMEVLKFFLENADFQTLRSAYPNLSGNVDKLVTLDIPGMKEDIFMLIDGEKILVKKGMVWKK